MNEQNSKKLTLDLPEHLLERFERLKNEEGLVDMKFMMNSGQSVANTSEHFKNFLKEVLDLRERRGDAPEDLLRKIDVK